jgi:hypothetical protein
MFKNIVTISSSLILLLLLFNSCSQQDPVVKEQGVKISGTITYDKVPIKIGKYEIISLDYSKIEVTPAKNVLVKALDENGQVLYQTTSNEEGKYSMRVPEETNLKIRVYAKMLKENSWDVAVVDNTNQKANYVIEGALHNSGNTASLRDLHAGSGWNGEGYSGERDAAPFAILDSINTVMQKVVAVDSTVNFPPLTVNWSINNVAAGGDSRLGQIVTSNYDGNSNLWILGDANSDTDEYDDHIIIHEWGHFFEDKFSRSDSIGGPHSSGDALDIRVAFGEGFGNALSAIATDNPLYFDTSGYNQSSGWAMNIESAPAQNPGWFSEASVQRILYDLYDKDDDGTDRLHLGFAPIFNAMVNKERNTPAFTSIFSFIHALKSENSSKSNKIDEVVAGEKIATIHDAYGNYRSNSANGTYTTPIYRTLEVGRWITQCNQNTYGVYNKLGNRTFIKVTIDNSGIYNFDAQPYGGDYGDPDIEIYKVEYPFKSLGMSPLEGASSDTLSISLNPGNYLVEVYDASFNNSCFIVKLNKDNIVYKPTKMSKTTIRRKPFRMPQY